MNPFIAFIGHNHFINWIFANIIFRVVRQIALQAFNVRRQDPPTYLHPIHLQRFSQYRHNRAERIPVSAEIGRGAFFHQVNFR